MKNSPAEQSGWKTGDAICTVDGQKIDAAHPSQALVTWSVAPAGTVVRLGMCDGTQRTLTARSFY
jgi:C-terminal processing protease CtpA/Prc